MKLTIKQFWLLDIGLTPQMNLGVCTIAEQFVILYSHFHRKLKTLYLSV